MVARIVLGFFVLVVVFVLVRALISGKIEFNAAGSGVVASRDKEPVAFWTTFLIGVAVVVCSIWLIF